MWQFIHMGRHMHMNLIYTHILCIEEYAHTQEDSMEKMCVKITNTLGIMH